MAEYDIVIKAVDNTKKTLSKVGGQLDGLSTKAGGLTKVLGVAGAALATFGAVSKISDTIDDFDKLAKRARNVGVVSKAAFKDFQIANQLLEEGGITASEADRAFGNLQGRLTKGINGGKAYAGVLKKLGSSILDMNGDLKSTPELFETVGQAVQDGTIDLEDAQKILGERVGPKIVGVFNAMKDSGMTAAEALADVAKHTNIVELDAAKNAEKFNDTVGRLGTGLGQLMTDAITPLLPMLTKLTDDLLAAMPDIINGVKKAFNDMKPVLDLIGIVFSEIIIPVLGVAWDLFKKLRDIIKPLADIVIPALGKAIKKVTGFIKSMAEKLTSLLTAMGLLDEKFETTTTSSVENAKSMSTAVVAEYKDMAADATKAIESIPTINDGGYAALQEQKKIWAAQEAALKGPKTDGGKADLQEQKKIWAAEDRAAIIANAKVYDDLIMRQQRMTADNHAARIIQMKKEKQLALKTEIQLAKSIPYYEFRDARAYKQIAQFKSGVKEQFKKPVAIPTVEFNLAGAYKQMGNFRNAVVEEFKKPISIPTVEFNLAGAYKQLGNVRNAVVEEFKKPVTILYYEFRDARAYKQMAEFRSNVKEQFKKPVAIPYVEFNLAGAYQQMGNFRNAVVEEFKKPISIPYVEFNLAGAYQQMGNFRNAVVEEFKKPIAIPYYEFKHAGAYKQMANAQTQAKKTSNIIMKTWDDMSKGMASSITEGIMSGKGLFNSFGDYLKDWANKILARIIEKMLIQPMVDQMGQWLGGITSGMGGMGGLMGGGGGMGGGLAGSIGSLAGGMGGGGGQGWFGFDWDLSSIFGGISDWFGGLWGGISSWFSGLGLFADGGYLPSGKVGIVGEAGPELITGPANVISNEDSFGGGGSVVININAIDTQTGTEFLLDNSRQIEGIIQNAYNRRGKEGIYS